MGERTLDSKFVTTFLIAMLTGISLGIQATINSQIGTRIGSIATGLLVIAAGGVLSAVAIVVLGNRLVDFQSAGFKQSALGIAAAGILAIIAIAGTAYALPRISVAAGLASIILGQMLVAVIVDTTGWGGVQQIPLNAERVIGLVLLTVAVWLLAPNN
jgi:transporter family-2 protein